MSQEHYSNLGGASLAEYHCEQVSVDVRDGSSIPMVIKYDKRYYSDHSPWVMFTKGVDSDKEMTSWRRNDIALLSRGIVCAYPLLRGT